MKYYGVTQYNHGHEYRWIFDGKTISKMLNVSEDKIVDDLNGEDIGFPIGGSNSSATWFCPIESDEDAKAFLMAAGDGPDLEDPILRGNKHPVCRDQEQEQLS